MESTITALRQDEHGDWIAELSCDHSQHVRHRPPWQQREWTTTAEGRASKLGQAMDCPLCDRITMPAEAREYKRTASFDEVSLPAALRADHSTRPGTWARIVVESGELEYYVRGRVHRLTQGVVGLVEPERLHHVSPVGPVRVHIEFWRQP